MQTFKIFQSRLLIMAALVLVTNLASAQIIFEKGYFIRNDGSRTECLIKNQDWKNNPREFQYKTESSTPETLDVLEATEFGIYGHSTYKTLTVNIDRSIFRLTEISTRNPEFVKQTLALKVIVDGTADLYYYEDGELMRFFYGVSGKTIEQLVFKEYLVETKIGRNEFYKQQLWLNVRCGDASEETMKGLRYTKPDLINYFQKFNRCSGDAVVEEEKPKREKMHLRLSPGLGLSTLKVRNYTDKNYNQDFSNHTVYHLGAEAEFVFPFNKNKWSLLIEPSLNSFKAEEGNHSFESTAKLNTLEVALGARHYIFINQNSKIFLDAMALWYMPLNESIEYLNLGANENFGAAAGIGYTYKRIGAEFRYYFAHETLANYYYWSAKQTKNLLILSYRIF